MNSRNFFLAFLVSMLLQNVQAQQTIVHDPVMIRQDSTYVLFCTGLGISSFYSNDMKDWKAGKPVFSQAPEWAKQAIPGFKGHIWAPDISYYKGRYNLFYSVSAFGKNTSCIGLATNPTLKPDDPKFQWTDHGKVIQSVPGRDDWNAIDPNLIVDEQSQPWLVFGSFWSGIKLVKLNPDLTGVAQPEEWHGLAKRPRTFTIPETEAGDGSIEAPFIFRHESYYYLFVSFDYCCRGINSTYKIMAGRSEKVTGPYLDKDGKPMMEGGGTLVLQGDKNYPGVGHNAVCTFNSKDYIVFHAYDAKDGGKSKLLIRELKWSAEGWPEAVLDN
jgi:arabinan endo-1,5-alpha-L-arabinosidase